MLFNLFYRFYHQNLGVTVRSLKRPYAYNSLTASDRRYAFPIDDK